MNQDERRAAHALLLRAAAGLLDVRPTGIWLDHEQGGRPVIGGADGALHVSLAHGRGVVAVALTAGVPVGVDVEAVRRLRAAAMARSWLDSAEAAWVSGLPEQDGSVGFLWLWTQKEAVGKALGLGLRHGGMSRRAPLPENWPPSAADSLVPVALPDTAGLASAAVLVDEGRYVIGVGVDERADGATGPKSGRRVQLLRVEPDR